VFIDGPNRFVGGTNAASRKVGGIREVTSSQLPVSPTHRGSAVGELPGVGYSAATNRISTTTAFTNTIDPNSIDNGVGVSWNDHSPLADALPAGATARYAVQWVAEQGVPLTATPAQATREVPQQHQVLLRLTDTEGDAVANAPVRWRVDGVNAFPAVPGDYVRAVTDASGQVRSRSWHHPGPGHRPGVRRCHRAENGVRDPEEPQASARSPGSPTTASTDRPAHGDPDRPERHAQRRHDDEPRQR